MSISLTTCLWAALLCECAENSPWHARSIVKFKARLNPALERSIAFVEYYEEILDFILNIIREVNEGIETK